MRPANRILSFGMLALGSVLATAAFAQNSARPMNDGGFVDYGASNPGAPSGQSDQAGTGLYGAPPADETATTNCAARFHSFDPATGTYLGFDGRRHACP